MFGDALIAEVMFVSLTHHWFFKNIHTNGTMIISSTTFSNLASS